METDSAIPGVTIRRRLAVGGMAELFLADRAGEVLVVKRALPGADQAYLELLRRERDALARIESPHVVRLLGGQDDYLLLEYVDGCDLGTLCTHLGRRGRSLDLAAALAAIEGLLRGLGDLHNARDADGRPLGLIHRDIKPSNVLLGADGSVKLTDLGVVHVSLSELPTLGGLKGTLAYMAPEQLMGGPVDVRSDLYSAGLVAYEVLTGIPARPAGMIGLSELMQARTALPAAPSSIRAHLTPELDQAVLRALCPDPEDRPPSAEAWLAQVLMAAPVEPDAGKLGQAATPVKRSVASASRTVASGVRSRVEEDVPIPEPVEPPPAHPPRASRSRLAWPLGLVLVAVLAVLGLQRLGETEPSPVSSSRPSGAGQGAPAATPAGRAAPRDSVHPESRLARREPVRRVMAQPKRRMSAAPVSHERAVLETRHVARWSRPAPLERPKAVAPKPEPTAVFLDIRPAGGTALYVSGAGIRGLGGRSKPLQPGAHVVQLTGRAGARATLRVVRQGDRLTARIGAQGRYYQVQCGGRVLGHTPRLVGIGKSITCKLTGDEETKVLLAFTLKTVVGG